MNNELVKELDKYSRRLNIIIKDMFLPEEETQAQLNKKIKKIITKELQLENAANDIDKLHREQARL